MKKDKAIFNRVLFLSLLVAPVLGMLFLNAPVLGMLFLNAPDGVDGTDALFYKVVIGFGFGGGIGLLFAILWLVKKIFSS